MRALVIAFTSLIAITAATPAAAQFRAEVHGGYDHSSADVGPVDIGDEGVVYGVGFGYDHQLGPNAFIGLDFSIDDSTAKECEGSVFVANDVLCVKAGRDLAAGIRGGVNVGERGKAYVLAGYTNARFRSIYTRGTTITRDGENLDGFRIGAGYQHGFGSNAYGKVEYRYSNYEADTSRHQVLVGVGLTF